MVFSGIGEVPPPYCQRGMSANARSLRSVLLAKAVAATGRRDEAQALIRQYWRDDLNSGEGEQAIVSAFGNVLSETDHQARIARLLRDGRAAEGETAARFLDEAPRQL